MQLEGILLSRAVRIASILGPQGRDVHGLRLARACEHEFEFLQGPRVVADFDLDKGITFLHGNYNKGMVIDKFTVFRNGVVVEAKTSTDRCDEFIDHILARLKKEIGLVVEKEHSSPRFYYSSLEVKCSFSLAEQLRKIAPIGAELSARFRDYGQPHVDHELVGLSFAPGAGNQPTFRFERRGGISEDARLYFSEAPLRTSDHLRLLEHLEKIMVG